MRKGLVWSLLFIIVLAVGSLGATIGLGHTPLLGLDLRGGVSVVLQPQHTATGAELDEAVTIIQRRVNGLGVSNSDVARQGNDVVINLPGIKNSQQALAELGQTATLYFRPVYCEIDNYVAPAKASTTTTVPAKTTTVPTTAKPQAAGHAARPIDLTAARLPDASPSTTVATKSTTTSTPAATTPTTVAPSSTPTTAVSENDCSITDTQALPTTPPSQDVASASVILPDHTNTLRYILGPADMTGSAVSDANAEVDTSTGQYTVNITFTSKGAVEFDDIAATRYKCYEEDTSNPPPCSLEAFELDGVVESAPTIQASSFSGTAVISGGSQSFTSAQANELALVLKYGSLPIRFVPQSVQTVSATIGHDSLRAGLLAGAGGLVVVILYILLYYRALGLVVVAGLLVGGAILYSLITQLSQTKGLTLTLAGVTGIIVSIGITVDSYVVYFERLKDEVRAGRTVRQSTERSFSRAFRTVLTADLVSFMAALILYLFTIGDVRGFAFTLGLSTLLDVFTAYFFIRPAVILVGRRRTFTDNRIFGITRGLGGTPGRTS